MYVATVPNRKSPPAILLRESYREGSKVHTRTIANLTLGNRSGLKPCVGPFGVTSMGSVGIRPAVKSLEWSLR